MRTTQPCGDYAGYRAHKRRNEDACDDCKKANAAHSRHYRGRPQQEQFRLYPTDEELARREQRRQARSSARNRALRKLGREYPERLAELVTKEISKVAG